MKRRRGSGRIKTDNSNKNSLQLVRNHSPNLVEGKEGACISLVEILNPHRDAEAIPSEMQRVAQGSHAGLLGFQKQQVELTVSVCSKIKSYFRIPFICCHAPRYKDAIIIWRKMTTMWNGQIKCDKKKSESEKYLVAWQKGSHLYSNLKMLATNQLCFSVGFFFSQKIAINMKSLSARKSSCTEVLLPP